MTWKGFLAAAAMALPLVPHAAATDITRILGPGGVQPNQFSGRPAISADGRYVAFESSATNLVPNDTNNRPDIFLYDRTTGDVKCVSVASDGTQANNYSFLPTISADGRYVVFESLASNLVPNDTNNTWDVFVHDTQTGETRRVSVDSAGNQANGYSVQASISGNGRYVVFQSDAGNLVPDDTNRIADAFIHDLTTGATTRASVSSDGGQSDEGSGYLPELNQDGRYAAFWSRAALAPGATKGIGNIFIRDTVAASTTLVTGSAAVPADADSAMPAISADGKYIAFYSDAKNLAPGTSASDGDIFLAERQSGTITRIAPAGDALDWIFGTLRPSISADGALVGFSSSINNVIPGKDNNKFLQTYLYSRGAGAISLLSATSGGAAGNGHSYSVAVSADGRWAAFSSEASNLVPDDTNSAGDIFLIELPGGAFTMADVGNALKIAGGLTPSNAADTARLGNPVTVQTAVGIARKAAGLEPNP